MKLRQRHSRGHCIHYLPEVKRSCWQNWRLQDGLDVGALARLPYLNAVCSETLRIYQLPYIPTVAKARFR